MLLYGIFIIFFFYALGEFLSWLIGGLFPGSVIGMLLLFFSLMMQWINPVKLRKAVGFFTSNMTLFFIPSAVGLMVSLPLIWNNVWAILLSVFITTSLVMYVVGYLQQKIGAKR